jgi:type II secretory pathway component PulC
MMPRHRIQTLFTWLMVAACLLLSWTIQRGLTALPSSRAAAPEIVSKAALAADSTAPLSVVIPDRDSLAVIVERPVFSESRRPTRSDEGPAPTLEFTLVGIVISDRERSAIVQPPHGRTVQRLAKGDQVGGWILVDIAPDHIVVRHDTTEVEMPLDYTTPAPPVAKAPAPNDFKANATKPTGAEPRASEAQGIVQDQPPEVLPPPDDDDDDAQPSSN